MNYFALMTKTFPLQISGNPELHFSINNDLTTSILSRVDSQPSGAGKKGTEHLQRGFQ